MRADRQKGRVVIEKGPEDLTREERLERAIEELQERERGRSPDWTPKHDLRRRPTGR